MDLLSLIEYKIDKAGANNPTRTLKLILKNILK